ncbi:MAG: flagella basal body P-ring formation protein FlgA [Sphingomonadaceae bacterium]|nr:flagella basal body P-ring formation protein FlgA [Sphingomonadaceae bacterium]
MFRPLAASLLITASPVLAQQATDLDALDRAVEVFTGAPVGATGGARQRIDRRLRLASCPVQPALEYYGNAQESVLIRCPVANGWRIFVPVNAAPQAQAAAPVVARGEAVAILVQGRGFTLSRQGEALDAGAPGEWIRVRPTGKRTDPIRAQVLRPGTVGMRLP